MTAADRAASNFGVASTSRDAVDDTDMTDIYLSAIGHTVLRRGDLLDAGFNEADINDSLPLLESRGMIQRLDQGSWRVLPPDVVLPAFAARLEDQARSVRASAAGLNRLYEQNRQRSAEEAPFEGAQVLNSMKAVAHSLTRIFGTARETVHMVCADSPFTRMLLDQSEEANRRIMVNSVGEPIKVMANYSNSLLELPHFPDMLKTRALRGDEQRITPGLQLTTVMNDEGLGLIDLEDQDGQPHGLLITDGIVAGAIAELTRWVWQLAAPWRPAPADSTFSKLTAQEFDILQLLAAGASDAAIARHLKVSQRTVERRVRALLDRFNATTRFQAGVLAARENLL